MSTDDDDNNVDVEKDYNRRTPKETGALLIDLI